MSQVPYTFAGNTGNIPLSQLDANFANVKVSVDYVIQPNQANITSVGTLTNLSVAGNVLTGGRISVAGNVDVSGSLTVAVDTISGNLLSPGIVSSTGNAIHGNILTAGLISASGSVNGGSFLTAGIMSSTGNATHGNILTAGLISAAGNVDCNGLTTNAISSGNINATDLSLSGNIIVAGNAQVNGTTTFINTQNLNIADKNITVANNVSTSALIDGAGLDAGNPPVAYIRYSNASLGWTTASNFSVGNNMSVTGNLTVTGDAFATTAPNGTSSTQLATTRFVGFAITNLNLGTMSTQNASSVQITGGNIAGITDLAVADGGTGASTYTANALLVGNGESSFQTISPGTNGNILASNGNTWISTQNLAFGPGQGWQDVTASRSTGVVYTNSTGRVIFVIAQVGNQANGIYVYINSTLLVRHWYDVNGGAGQIGYGTGEFMVGPGDTYEVSGGPLRQWWEYRA